LNICKTFFSVHTDAAQAGKVNYTCESDENLGCTNYPPF